MLGFINDYDFLHFQVCKKQRVVLTGTVRCPLTITFWLFCAVSCSFMFFFLFFLFLFFYFFFIFSFISCGASFIERKKIKINYRISFMSFSYIYPNFLLNGTHISLTLTSTAKYLLTFSFLLFPLSFFIFILFIIICLLKVCLDRTYFAETENLLLKSL